VKIIDLYPFCVSANTSLQKRTLKKKVYSKRSLVYFETYRITFTWNTTNKYVEIIFSVRGRALEDIVIEELLLVLLLSG